MTIRIALVTLLAALALPASVAQADNPKLVAVVGTNDAFVISLRDGNGNAVTQLAPGTYDLHLVVTDGGQRVVKSAIVRIVN